MLKWGMLQVTVDNVLQTNAKLVGFNNFLFDKDWPKLLAIIDDLSKEDRDCIMMWFFKVGVVEDKYIKQGQVLISEIAPDLLDEAMHIKIFDISQKLLEHNE